MPVRLLTQVEGFDQSLVSCEVTSLEVVKELTTAGNHLQKTATAVVVFRVNFEVLCEFVDTSGQKSNLNLRRSGVTLGLSELLDDFSFLSSSLCNFIFLCLSALRATPTENTPERV